MKNMIRAYPGLRKEYDDLHQQSITANMSGMPGGGAVSRGTENIALKELPKMQQMEYDAVRKAIAVTEKMRNGAERLKIINLVFWKNSHTLQGAAMAVPISYETAVEYHRDFIMIAAYFRELVDGENLSGIQKLALKSQKDVIK
mgnify:CR=1 FL=1